MCCSFDQHWSESCLHKAGRENKSWELEGLDWRMFIDPDVGAQFVVPFSLRHRRSNRKSSCVCRSGDVRVEKRATSLATYYGLIKSKYGLMSYKRLKYWHLNQRRLTSLLTIRWRVFVARSLLWLWKQIQMAVGLSWTHWVMRLHASDWPAFVYLQAVILQPCHAKH